MIHPQVYADVVGAVLPLFAVLLFAAPMMYLVRSIFRFCDQAFSWHSDSVFMRIARKGR